MLILTCQTPVWQEPLETLFEGKQTNRFKLVLTHYHINDNVFPPKGLFLVRHLLSCTCHSPSLQSECVCVSGFIEPLKGNLSLEVLLTLLSIEVEIGLKINS